MNNRKLLLCKTVFLVLSSFSGHIQSKVFDQEPASDEMLVLEPITIAPGKISSQLLPTMQAHTEIISNEQLIGQPSIIGVIENSAGIAANGQGGRLQNYSIRGISRQRVMTQISNVRIVTDRRAGTAANFIDPILFEHIDIYRGASSSQSGSGALGGTVNITPRTFNQGSFSAGYNSLGDENYQMLGWGNSNTSIAISRRDAGNSKAANGDELNTHFSQYSAVINHHWEITEHDFNILIIPALANNSGKSNTDFPNRITNYPTEKHLFVKLDITPYNASWNGEFSVHINTLDTQVIRKNTSETKIENKSYDFSAKLFKAWGYKSLLGQFGLEYFGRRGVESTETEHTFSTMESIRQTTLDDGEGNEYALFNNITWKLGPGELQAGLRYSYLLQSHRRESSIDEHILAGNIGYLLTLSNDLELSGLFSTGFRMPSLSERYFSGVTGRGTVVGNQDLVPEFAYHLDLGMNHFGDNHSLSIHGFYNIIENYIERFEIQENVLAFKNISAGVIYGIELENKIYFYNDMQILWNLTWMQGKDNEGRSLNDIPAHQAFFEYAYKPGNWQFGLQLRALMKKKQIGSNEKITSSANILSALIGYDLNQDIAVKFSAENLLDENYNNSADRKAATEPGRSFGFIFQATF